MTPRVAIVVVNYGSSSLLERNLADLELPPRGFVIAVDCFSSAAERDSLLEACARHGWTDVLLDENVGFGAGMNVGADAALAQGAEVLVALNPDAQLGATALAAMVDAAFADSLTLASPHIVTGDGRPWFRGSDLYLDDGSIAGSGRRAERAGRLRREWATGACFAVSAELWRRVGGFDEDYFLYWEDVDLCHRILDAGGRLLLLDVTAVHDEGQTHADASSRSGVKSETYYYYNIRNRLLYARKNLDGASVRRWLRATPRVSMGIVLQGGKRQLATLPPWRALVRGIRDGRRMARRASRADQGPSVTSR